MHKFFLILSVVFIFTGCSSSKQPSLKNNSKFNILVSSENEDLEQLIYKFAQDKKIDISIDFAGTLDIIDIINVDVNDYDAVWLSNSIWFSQLENPAQIKKSKSIFIEPVVFGIKKSKASELGFTDKDKKIYLSNILDAIKNKDLKFIMPSVTQTNSGASAYLGFLNNILGNPFVLTEELLDDANLKSELTELFAGVERSSGNDQDTIDMFTNGNYDAMVNYESSIISLNKDLIQNNKEPLYIVYPYDGVSLSDAPFAYIDNGNENKEKTFIEIQNYLLENETQKQLTELGRRAGYGGLVPYASSDTFNIDWGIDTSKYISPIKYPSQAVIKSSLNLYQTELRKPIAVVFCLDYSGSMIGNGKESLVNAMNYILNNETASKDMIQFSKKDKIIVIPFSTEPWHSFMTEDGEDTTDLIEEINKLSPDGRTNIHGTSVVALEELAEFDANEYSRSVILMTDGASNETSFPTLQDYYVQSNSDIPIFSITFGSADTRELEQISELTNAFVFDGKKDLVKAFKTVRSYN